MLRSRYLLVIFSLMLVPFSSYASHCPEGAYHGLDNQGNEACRTTVGNNIVDPQTGLMYDSQTGELVDGQFGLPNWVPYAIIAMIVFAIILKLANRKPQPKVRQNFSPDVEEQTLKNQGYRCNECHNPIGQVKGRIVYYEYDHMDGDNSNNDQSNCQALCRNCHAHKTEKERGKYDHN